MTYQCQVCCDTGHVCENCPDRAWEMPGEYGRDCAARCGAGMPCPACCSPIPLDGSVSIGLAFIPDWKRSEYYALRELLVAQRASVERPTPPPG